MNLPSDLRDALDTQTKGVNPSELKRAAAELSKLYKTQQPPHHQFLDSRAHQLAYLAVRMPATYGAVFEVLTRLKSFLEASRVQTLLDLGSGPGTASWATAAAVSTIEEVTLLERNPAMVALGRDLARFAKSTALKAAHWVIGDIVNQGFGEHDLVIMSYSLGELPKVARKSVLAKAWTSSRKALVIVEPGTPAAFAHVIAARTSLLEAGANLLAPCPHELPCPMERTDWCHFAARIERSRLHRFLKSGEHGFEDEKYSYVAASKEPVALPTGRIVRHPRYSPGLVHLTLCVDGRIEIESIRQSQSDVYRAARKARWSDPWNGQEPDRKDNDSPTFS
jgi:ribosomal protein RSM22 (predicted rRNA methylase)